jgi:lactate dehydrogenase-like 2-hydroxyacid dehydrogenase
MAKKPLIVVVDPQHAQSDVEEALCGSDFDIAFVPFDQPPGTRLADDIYARADAWLNYRSRHRIDAAIVARLVKCRIVVTSGVGFDHIDLDAASAAGIPVCNVPDYGTTDVADHALALLLALARGVAAYDTDLRAREKWATLDLPSVCRLRGRTIGIVGLGRIGQAFARRAAALDMDVGFFDPYLSPGAELGLGYRRYDSLQALLAGSQILSLHTPLDAKTVNLIDAAALAALPRGAMLINTSRGKVLDLDALEAALRSGHVRAAGLDVLASEPPDFSHPLLAAWKRRDAWLADRLIVTPHAAFHSPESIADKRRLTTSTAIDYLKTGRLRACLNEAAIARFR